jgi:hypothetical protein
LVERELITGSGLECRSGARGTLRAIRAKSILLKASSLAVINAKVGQRRISGNPAVDRAGFLRQRGAENIKALRLVIVVECGILRRRVLRAVPGKNVEYSDFSLLSGCAGETAVELGSSSQSSLFRIGDV